MEWKTQPALIWLLPVCFGLSGTFTASSLHSERGRANCVMASIARATAAIAAILAREGIDYAQSKAVFKAARQRAGLRAPTERRGGVDRLTVEEELRFLDQAYGQDGRTGYRRKHSFAGKHFSILHNHSANPACHVQRSN